MLPDASVTLAVLGTRWAEQPRPEVELRGRFRPPQNRKYAAPVRFMDWTIDGEPLGDRLGSPRGRPCTNLTWMVDGSQGDPFVVESLRVLLGDKAAGADPWVKYSDGRAGILFCSQCHDLACGAVSAHVRFSGTTVEWCEIAYQDGTSEEVYDDDENPAFTVTFDRKQYESIVRALLVVWGSPARS